MSVGDSESGHMAYFRQRQLESKSFLRKGSDHLTLSPEHRDQAEQKLVQFLGGVQTRYKFTRKEEELAEWIEQITRKQINANSPQAFTEALSDGAILCDLMNAIVPGAITDSFDDEEDEEEVSELRSNAFLEQCEALGVSRQELFDPFDLIYQRNTVKVIYCLFALAEICHQKRLAPFFQGTNVERQQQKREWRKKAKERLRRGFEDWKMGSTLLENMEADGGSHEEEVRELENVTAPRNVEEEEVDQDYDGASYEPMEMPARSSGTTDRGSAKEPATEPSAEKRRSTSPSQPSEVFVPKRSTSWSASKAAASSLSIGRFVASQLAPSQDITAAKLVSFWAVCFLLWGWTFFTNQNV